MVLKSADEFTKDSEAKVFVALAAGACLVTANNRLARHIQLAYGEAQRRAGRTAWETPDILPFHAYIVRAGERVRMLTAEAGPALTDAQEQWIWADLVRAQGNRFLCDDGAFAGLARQAFKLVADYRLPLPPPNGGLETDAFLLLARAFERELARIGREDGSREIQRVARALREGRLTPPPRLFWAGFHELTPAQAEVFAACEAAGGLCEILPLPDLAGSQQAFLFPTVENECVAALLWAREKIRDRPQGRYGLVVPDLESYRVTMTRLADDILERSASPGRAYELSLGESLKDAPVVAAACRLWRALDEPLSALDAASLIQSPFISGTEGERGRRAQAAYEVLDEGKAVGLSDLVLRLSSAGTPHFSGAVGRLSRTVRAWPKRASPSAWCRLLGEALEVVRWPGSLSKPEHQAVAALREVLESVAGLDAVVSSLSYGRVLSLVDDALVARVFQGEVRGASLQVLGPLEAVGLSFDGLWIANLHDRVWPATRQPHPLLPLAWQREHHLPHAHVEDDIRFAQALITDFVKASPDVILSTALHDGKEPQRPSRALEGYGLQQVPAPLYKNRAGRVFATRLPLEEIPEVRAPLVMPRSPGYGTGLFAAQAACPFRAAAQYRLQADPLTAPAIGLSPATRGAVLHKALEHWFSALPDPAMSHALDPQDREERIREALVAALDAAQEDFRAFPVAYKALEATRMQGLLRGFLAFEEARGPFLVEACEKEVVFPVGALVARGRIDRVDKVGGRSLLIDYKTGRIPKLDLDAERPQYPQLLLYALAEGPTVAGFAYADLSASGPAYKVWAQDDSLWPDATLVPDWEEKRAQWRGIFERLAAQFVEGVAPVDPAPGACEYCGRQSLCRVGEEPSDDI